MPSFPNIPHPLKITINVKEKKKILCKYKPIWASYIIFTSFAPSPTAKVILFNPYLINLTISAFYLGVTLQHTTDSQSFEIFKNAYYNISLSKIIASDSPSTRRLFWILFYIHD